MSSFVDQQFRLIGQHMRNAPDSSPGSLRGAVSKRREHDDMEQQLEAETGEEEERGMRRPGDLDLGFRSKLENPSMVGGTVRQTSFTSDLDLTPSTELSPWHDLHLAVDDREWTEERRTKQWTDPPLQGAIGFPVANSSLETNRNSYENRNKGVADGVRGGLGRVERRDGRDNDVGSDSDSGKGTVSDCRQSPTEEISFRGSLIEETLKQSSCGEELERTTSVKVNASSAEHRKSERTLDNERDYLAGVSYLTELQRISDSKPTLHHYSDHDCYPVLPDSSLGVSHTARLSKVERYLAPGSPGEKSGQTDGRFGGDKGFSGDVRIHGVIDSNNNNSLEFSSPSQVDNLRCHDALTPLRHARRVDTSHEFKGTSNRTMHCGADDDVVDAGHDLTSISRRQLQAKCQDMYGSRPCILGSQDIHGRFGSHQNVHDSRHDVNGSHRDIYPRHESQFICHDAYNSNCDEIKGSHYDAENDSRYDINGSHAAGISGQVYHHRGRGFHAENQDQVHAMRGSRDAFPTRHELTHASHDSIHDNRLQSGIGYNRSPSLTDSPSKISADYSFGGNNVPGSLNSTPGKRYYNRRESPAPSSGFGTPCYSTPQKGHRYTRKSTADNSFAHTASESDPEIFHEELDKSFPGSSHGNITPAQYRRIRSVPHDRTPTAGPRSLGSIQPALQQPFSDEEPVTLPRPAKPGRSAAASSAAEQQAMRSCGKTEVRGHRQRPNRRWTNLGLSSGEPEVEDFRGKTKTTGNQSGIRFRVPSLFRSKKDSTSATSPGNGSGTPPGTGAPVIVAGSRGGGNGAKIRSDSETGSKVRSRTGTAVESGFETGSSLGSAGDISIWSLSLGSTQSVFDTGESPVPVQGMDAGDDHFRRSVSVPDPDGRGRSSTSILDRLRARLLPRKKSVSSSKDGLNETHDQRKSSGPSANGSTDKQSREEIQLTVLPLFNNSQATGRASIGQTDGDDDEADRCDESSMATVSMTTNSSMTTTFVPCTPTKSEESAIRKVSFMDTNASAASSPSIASSSSTLTAALRQTSATPDSFQSKTRNGRVALKRTPPSEDCLNAVSEIIDSLAGLTDFVDSSIASAPPTERTITEVEFKEFRSLMIDAVKQFNQACKQMVIKTPESEPAFLEALQSCRCSLDDVADKYCALVDCASLPADRSKVAIPVIAVANSLRETVTVAFRVTGCSARDPAMLSLRRSANRLVADLGLLMRSVREMNYNRLSRRF